ncbi:hypothetical protein NliqN6_3408 [Naganishia liquefaciens]|uniref:Uncharacterized protein n=1 Tax=Naganishia liquefaciens TaxID=104408 RepID=A0A8H3TU66_9TREE|nr:hypothetical protein NliqN6_3408 [Naganishia liquefaciens]
MPHHSEKSTFQPVHPFDLENPRSWAETAGTMDWDTTHICFTKRSLLDFLKQVGVSVGTNYTEISKLPKYASFGKFSQAATNEAVKDLVDAEIADPSSATSNVHTTRKVTQPPGGPTSVTISGEKYEEQDALSMAPPRGSETATGSGQQDEGATLTHTEQAELASVTMGTDGIERPPGAVPGFRPTRKVREAPGGKSDMSNLLFGGYNGN